MKKTNLDCNKLSNYRPISKLPLLSNIIEKIVSRQIIEYLLFHNLFDEYQNAYRPGHSTETTLLKFADDILKYLDNYDSVQLILLDLSCAFDSLDHSILIDRIKSIGFTGSSLDWIISYLSNRTYLVYKHKRIIFTYWKITVWSTTRLCSGSPFIFYMYCSSFFSYQEFL